MNHIRIWGVAILSNDLAEDIRLRYKDLLGDEYSDEKASEIVIQEYKNEIAQLKTKTDSYDDYREIPQKIAAYQSGSRDRFFKRASLVAEGFSVTSDTDPPYTLLSWKDLNAFIYDENLNEKKI